MTLQSMKAPYMRVSTSKNVLESPSEFLGTHGTLEALNGQPSALRMLEFYTIEPSGQLLIVYEVPCLAAGDSLQVDDLEFSVDEQLSQDEVAQCIFAISGGEPNELGVHGETANFFVYYSVEQKGLLGLTPKTSTFGEEFSREQN